MLITVGEKAGELEKYCHWGNEVKLYQHHVNTLFAMFRREKQDIKYYVCNINETFAKPGQRMFCTMLCWTEDATVLATFGFHKLIWGFFPLYSCKMWFFVGSFDHAINQQGL
ncbi:hypothetical protein ACQJBY_032053 [Aegilops geniculata]